MGSIQPGSITDYSSFEEAYDRLIEKLDGVLEDGHKFVHRETGELVGLLNRYADDHRYIGETPEARDNYVAVKFLENGTVALTYPERRIAAGRTSIFTVDKALAKALIPAISIVSSKFARENPNDDIDETRSKEFLRLFRILSEEWADEYENHGRILPIPK